MTRKRTKKGKTDPTAKHLKRVEDQNRIYQAEISRLKAVKGPFGISKEKFKEVLLNLLVLVFIVCIAYVAYMVLTFSIKEAVALFHEAIKALGLEEAVEYCISYIPFTNLEQRRSRNRAKLVT